MQAPARHGVSPKVTSRMKADMVASKVVDTPKHARQLWRWPWALSPIPAQRLAAAAKPLRSGGKRDTPQSCDHSCNESNPIADQRRHGAVA